MIAALVNIFIWFYANLMRPHNVIVPFRQPSTYVLVLLVANMEQEGWQCWAIIVETNWSPTNTRREIARGTSPVFICSPDSWPDELTDGSGFAVDAVKGRGSFDWHIPDLIGSDYNESEVWVGKLNLSSPVIGWRIDDTARTSEETKGRMVRVMMRILWRCDVWNRIRKLQRYWVERMRKWNWNLNGLFFSLNGVE